MEKKKKSKAVPKKPRTRAKYKCPDELAELIRLSNLVPIGITMPDYDWEVRSEIKRLREETDDPSPEFSAYEFLIKQTKRLPKEFLDFLEQEAYGRVFPFGSESESFRNERSFRMEFIRQYVEYCDMRGSMIWLVLRLENEQRRMRDTEKQYGLKENSLTFEHYRLLDWDAFPITIKTTLVRNDNGKLQITGLAALIGTFDDSRLRRCKICERIYWMKREGSDACSSSCAAKLRQKRFYQKKKQNAVA